MSPAPLPSAFPPDPAPSERAADVPLLRSHLREALTKAMKERRPDAVRALRSAIGALDNAEAVAPPGATALTEGPIAGAALGLGAAEAARRPLTQQDVTTILEAEISDRRTAAVTYEQVGALDRAVALRAEADELAAFLTGAAVAGTGESDARAANLAGFVAATAGRRGTVAQVRGGVVVAGPVAVPNGFVNAAVPTDASTPAAVFLDEAAAFFATHDREFVLWLPDSRTDLADEAARRGAQPTGDPSPAMVVHHEVSWPAHHERFTITAVTTEHQGQVFADLAERGYGIPGLGWLLTEHDAFNAPGTTWAIAADGDEPVSVACGYIEGDVGGVYYVATPPELRGRGAAAAVTAWVTNAQLAQGAEAVILQASRAGFPIYERLGFTTYDGYQHQTLSS